MLCMRTARYCACVSRLTTARGRNRVRTLLKIVVLSFFPFSPSFDGEKVPRRGG